MWTTLSYTSDLGHFLMVYDSVCNGRRLCGSKFVATVCVVWKNLTGLHRVLTSIPSNTFGMNWNCEPDLLIQHQLLTSSMLLWLNGSKSLQPKSSTILWKAWNQKSGCYKSIWMPMVNDHIWVWWSSVHIQCFWPCSVSSNSFAGFACFIFC